jgi:ribosomal protein L11 methyltransferase
VRELAVRLPVAALEDALDVLLPIVPDGVRELPRGDQIELRMRGPELPGRELVAAALRPWGVEVAEHEVADDWRERRRADFEPDAIAGRLVVRPDWARAAGSGMLEIVLGAGGAFGAGTHPTTRACLEWLLQLPVSGSFADLGCGTGVLAILAAKLGFAPVTAVDIVDASVETARANAASNGVEVATVVADLASTRPPAAGVIAANVPASVHEPIAARLVEPLPRFAVLTGFGPREADQVLAGYLARGLAERARAEVSGWTVAQLERR